MKIYKKNNIANAFKFRLACFIYCPLEMKGIDRASLSGICKQLRLPSKLVFLSTYSGDLRQIPQRKVYIFKMKRKDHLKLQ